MPKATLAVVGHVGPAPRGDKMSVPHGLAGFAALGQPTRLAIFQLLMSAEPDGLAAGAIANKVGCPHNTLSSHLRILARSGLGGAHATGARSSTERTWMLSAHWFAFLSMIAATAIPSFATCKRR